MNVGKKFCPKCGKIIKNDQSFCKNCIVPEFDFKDINIVLCIGCNSYLYKSKWTKFSDINDPVKKISMDSIKSKVEINDLDEETVEKLLVKKPGIKSDFTVEVYFKNNLFDLPAKFETTTCPKCSKKGTKYFESILQVRNSNDEINSFIKSEVKKNHSKGVYINKEVKLNKYSNENIDFYLTNQSYAKVLAEKIKSEFGGIIKKNPQLFSIDWETSKNIYRLNILVELPKYKLGDVIKDDSLYKIIKISDRITVVNLRTLKKTSFKHGDYQTLRPSKFQVIKKFPEYEVLDPVTYYQAILKNPSKNLEVNETILAVIDGSEAWMI